MKKRVLFVDDETMVLQGLRRMLRSMRNEWEMDFVDSGRAALDRMADHPYDVVVSDMRMPGMDGAQLLTEVMNRHPKTVRIILSGHADHELVLKSIGSTHQYLTKPCEPEELKLTVSRASLLGDALVNDHVKSLVSRMEHLPSLPDTYLRIVEELQSPDASLERVGEIIGRDVAITAQVLKLVNSAFFGLRRRVANTVDAVTYLGMDTIKALVLSLNTFSHFEKRRLGGLSLLAMRNHSLFCAAASKHVARAESRDQNIIDDAFIGGLLHDTGKLILAANFPDEYQTITDGLRTGEQSVEEAERQHFQCAHPEVGGYLLGLWGLPVTVVECISLHHEPHLCPSRDFTALTAVHAGNVMAYELDDEPALGRPPAFHEDYLRELGRLEHVDQWRAVCQQLIQTRGGE